MRRKAEAKAPVPQAERRLLCFLDRTGEAEIGGWAVDFGKPAQSLKVRVVIDEAIQDVIVCDLHRDDSRLVNLANSRIGFRYRIPERYWDGVRHTIRFFRWMVWRCR